MRALLLSLCLLLTACPAQVQLPTEPAVTGKGEPNGTATTAVIGAAGGTLRSGDGRFELVVPAGALSADTTFSATPLSKKAPGALAAWRLEPEGTTFTTPATVRFTASAADLAGSEAAALRLAYQDAMGQWRAFQNATIDGNSISVSTRHLSDWSPLLGWQLTPGTASVDFGKTVKLTPQYCNVTTYNAGTDDELVGLVATCQASTEDLSPLLSKWSVNGTVGGSASVGTIEQGNPSATYTAPGSEPGANPVAVSVEIALPSKGTTRLVSNITVGSTLPNRYTGSFNWHRRTGVKNSVVAFEEMSGNATVTFVRWPEQGTDAYKMSGQFQLTGYSAEMGDCDCTSGGASGPISTGASLNVRSDGTMRFGFSTMLTLSLTCTPRNAGATCVDSVTVSPGWGLTTLSAGCTGAMGNTYTDAASLNGTWTQLCTPDLDESMSWSFAGAP